MAEPRDVELVPPLVTVISKSINRQYGTEGMIWRTEDITGRGVDYYKNLLDSGWDVNKTNSNGFTALHYAGMR